MEIENRQTFSHISRRMDRAWRYIIRRGLFPIYESLNADDIKDILSGKKQLSAKQRPIVVYLKALASLTSLEE